MSNHARRRSFLKQGVAAALGLSVLPLPAAPDVPACLGRTDTAKRVIVIGAGMAGLSAALELDRAGHHVTLLEAQSRPGGRVLTLRKPFARGMYADAGAARIHTSHGWTLGYVERFDLELVPFYPSRLDFVYLDGRTPTRVDWSRFSKEIERLLWMRLGRSKHWFKIKGGNDLLTKAFAERLGDKIVYRAPVVKIEQDLKTVHVSFSRDGRLETLSADYVICTIPFTVLADVEVTPPFSNEKKSVIGSVRYTSASRVFLQFRNRFWQEQQTTGFAITDLPAEVWPSTFQQSGAQENFLQGASKCWSQDPWVRAAWAHPAWDDLPEIRRPEGRLYLAGEHTSAWPSSIQGALEAGNHAAGQVHRAP